jgi:hypothetical protein
MAYRRVDVVAAPAAGEGRSGAPTIHGDALAPDGQRRRRARAAAWSMT